jgi:hypothetical protein
VADGRSCLLDMCSEIRWLRSKLRNFWSVLASPQDRFFEPVVPLSGDRQVALERSDAPAHDATRDKKSFNFLKGIQVNGIVPKL